MGEGTGITFIDSTPTQGNVEDREPLKNQSFVKALKGKLYADKAYISQELTFRTWMMGKLHYKPYLRTDCLFILSEKTNHQIPTCQKLNNYLYFKIELRFNGKL